MKTANIFDMSLEEYHEFQKKELKKNGLCLFCNGFGTISEAGMFSSTYKCEKCNGTGKSKR